MNRSTSRIFAACLIGLILLNGGVRAQDKPIEIDTLIYSGGVMSASSLYWWNDQLFFIDVMTGETKVFRYSTETDEVVQVDDYPLTLTLTAEQQQHYRAYSERALISPDNEAIFYTSQFDRYVYAEGGGWLQLFSIGQWQPENYRGGTYLPLRIPEIHEPYTLLWSDDNKSFVLWQGLNYGGMVNLYHVQLKWIQTELVTELIDVQETYIGTTEVVRSVYDISSDGQRVLYGDFHGYLMLWDARTPPIHDETYGTMSTAEQIMDEPVSSATFIPGDDEHILIVNEQGIVYYNLITQESQVINDEINSTWALAGLFSSDNQYLAVLEGEYTLYTSLRVLPLDDLLGEIP